MPVEPETPRFGTRPCSNRRLCLCLDNLYAVYKTQLRCLLFQAAFPEASWLGSMPTKLEVFNPSPSDPTDVLSAILKTKHQITPIKPEAAMVKLV